jgi:hypothetical protein
MSGYPGFGVLLARLLDHRELGLADLARQSRFPEPELLTVRDGAPPDPSLLRQLAPALGLHTADLFVMAWVPVPDELIPLDPGAGRLIPSLVRTAVRLPPQARARLRDFAQSLPQHDRPQPHPVPPPRKQYEPGFGATLARLLDNRNLDWAPAANTLALLDSPPLAPATIGAIGRGRKELTPSLLAAFATLLGIPAGDLAALGGIQLPDTVSSPDGPLSEIADLIWDVRRLTTDQIRQVIGQAASAELCGDHVQSPAVAPVPGSKTTGGAGGGLLDGRGEAVPGRDGGIGGNRNGLSRAGGRAGRDRCH